jgi:hypothetical protein
MGPTQGCLCGGCAGMAPLWHPTAQLCMVGSGLVNTHGTSSVIHACCFAVQAYYKLSQLLKDHNKLLVQRSLVLEAVPEEFQAPMKKLRMLRPASALKEQLDSIVPGIEGPMERLQVTYELMMGWAQSEQLEMPAAVRAMYS